MDKLKKIVISFIACGLIPWSTQANDFPQTKIGQISQTYGQTTFLTYKVPSTLYPVKKNSPFFTDGSYLTRDNSFFTAQLFDGSFLRASPKTKFAVELDTHQKMATIYLFTGSIKVLISRALNQGKLEKIIVKSGDGVFEASEAKFSVVRNPVLSDVSIYVEKGSLLARAVRNNSQEDLQLIHTMEGVTLKDKTFDIDEPHRLTAREKKWLHANFYLRPIGKYQN